MNVSRWIIETYGADNGLRDLVYNVQRLAGMFVTLTVPNDLSMQIIDFAKSEEHLAERGLRQEEHDCFGDPQPPEPLCAGRLHGPYAFPLSS